MIDWPNLLAAFVLGLVPWLIDRARAKGSRRREVEEAWKAAAKSIEVLSFMPDTTHQDLYRARVGYPIDTWREILGPDDFRALEELENAFHAVERWTSKVDLGEIANGEIEQLRQARKQKVDAVATFANLSRRAQSIGYTNVVRQEERRKVRADLLRSPVKTIRRERHNRRVRKAAGIVAPRRLK